MATLGTFVAGQVLTAAELNAIGTWTTFTPVWTNVTVGNGTTNYAKYCQLNDVVLYSLRFTLGSTSTVSLDPKINVPVATATTGQGNIGIGSAVVGGTVYNVMNWLTSSQIFLYLHRADGTYVRRSSINGTTPGTFASGDILEIQGAYFL